MPVDVPFREDGPDGGGRCLQCGTAISSPANAVVTDEGEFCSSCFSALKQQLEHAARSQSADINYSAALLGGVLGGLLGTLVWWGFTVVTRISFGLVAVVIGIAVGKGVLYFSGGKRSLNLQILSAGIAALSFFYAQYLVTRTFLVRYFEEQEATQASLPILPDPGVFFDVVRLDFGLFDVIFLAIVVFQAWKIPAPFRLRMGEGAKVDQQSSQPDHARNLGIVARHLSGKPRPPRPDPGDPPPKRGKVGRMLRRWGPAGVFLAFVLGKLKLLIPLLKFAKIGTLGTMLVMVWVYTQFWGMAFALGFVLLIFVHEMGHALVMRQQGIRAGAPVFIPFVGAVIAMKQMPKNAYVEALVAIGGPALGTLGAIVCLLIAAVTGSLFWYALASTGFLINLFNMIPISPLDGGRIVGVISRWIWVIGYAVGIGVFLVTHSPILFLILLLGLFGLGRTLKGPRAGYYEVPAASRRFISVAYFGLLVVMVLGMWTADQPLEGFRETGMSAVGD